MLPINLPPAEIRPYKPFVMEECPWNILKTYDFHCLDLGGYPFRYQGTQVNPTLSGTYGTSNALGSIPGTMPGAIPLGASPFGNTTSAMGPGFNGLDGSIVNSGPTLVINFVSRDGPLTGANNDWINIADAKFNQVEIRKK